MYYLQQISERLVAKTYYGYILRFETILTPKQKKGGKSSKTKQVKNINVTFLSVVDLVNDKCIFSMLNYNYNNYTFSSSLNHFYILLFVLYIQAITIRKNKVLKYNNES